MKLIGREQELSILKKLYENPNYEGILLYGRRQISKSALIQEFIKDLPWPIFNCSISDDVKQCLSATIR